MINKRSTTPKKAAQSLRRRAEKILKGQKKMPTAPSPKDMKRLFHELETHQVELEIQNQGLREAQTEVEASRRKYAELYHFAPVGYFTLDKNGIILEVNVTGAAMLGVSNRLLAGKPFSHFIVDIKDRKAFASHRDKVLRHGIKNACELKLGSLEAASFHARLESIPTEDSEGELTLIRTTVSDITERKKTEVALRESEERFRGIIENLQDGYIRANKEGIIVMVSPSVARMCGVQSPEQMIGIPARSLYKNSIDRAILLKELKKRGELIDYEIEALRKDGTSFPISLNVQFYHDAQGQIQGTEAFVRDITERKKAEETEHRLLEEVNATRKLLEGELNAMAKLHAVSALIASPGNMQHILSEVLDAAISISGADFGNIQLWDEGCSCLRIYVQRGFPLWWTDYWNNRVSEGQGSCGTALACKERVIIEDIEQSPIFVDTDALEIQRRAGVRAVQSTPLICRLGILRGMVSTQYKTPHRPDDRELRLLDLLARSAADIITQVLSREDLLRTHDELEERVRERTQELVDSQEQLRNLSSRLQDLREEERTNVAREIHDDLGQALAALKMDLSWIVGKLPDDSEGIKKRLESDVGEVDNTIQAVKRVCTELRPGILDHLGLAAAVEWQAGEFQKRTGIKCKISLDPEDIQVDTALRTPLFRIFQEALTNVLKHAKATKVTVSLKRTDSNIVLEITDNGIGMKEKDLSKISSFGLLGMRERVLPFGGTLSVKGLKKKGTVIAITLPITQADAS